MKLSNKKKRLAFEFQKILLARAIEVICDHSGDSREKVFEWLIDGEKWNGVKIKKE